MVGRLSIRFLVFGVPQSPVAKTASRRSVWPVNTRFLLPLAFAANLLHAAMPSSPQILPLWDGVPPNHKESDLQEQVEQVDRFVMLSKVQEPTIEVRLPSRGNANGKAVVVCPGGGYGILAYDWEGTDIASWLNANGVAAIVLKYRLPEDASNVVPHLTPLLDAKRAMRLTRFHAQEWGIDPAKIGVMGFSAGGHLASTLGTHFDSGDASSEDPVERLSSRPDFMILMYPVISMDPAATHGGSRENLLGKNPSAELVKEYSNELQVTADTPPTILIHSSDDQAVPVQNSLRFYEALVAHGVTAEMHIYPYGGHGYSLAIGQGRLQGWTVRCMDWIEAQ